MAWSVTRFASHSRHLYSTWSTCPPFTFRELKGLRGAVFAREQMLPGRRCRQEEPVPSGLADSVTIVMNLVGAPPSPSFALETTLFNFLTEVFLHPLLLRYSQGSRRGTLRWTSSKSSPCSSSGMRARCFFHMLATYTAVPLHFLSSDFW